MVCPGQGIDNRHRLREKSSLNIRRSKTLVESVLSCIQDHFPEFPRSDNSDGGTHPEKFRPPLLRARRGLFTQMGAGTCDNRKEPGPAEPSPVADAVDPAFRRADCAASQQRECTVSPLFEFPGFIKARYPGFSMSFTAIRCRNRINKIVEHFRSERSMVSCRCDHAVLCFYEPYRLTGLFGNPVNFHGLLTLQNLF